MKSYCCNRVGVERLRKQQRLGKPNCTQGIASHHESATISSARATASHHGRKCNRNKHQEQTVGYIIGQTLERSTKMNQDQTFTVRCAEARVCCALYSKSWPLGVHLGSTRSRALHHEGQLGTSHRPPPANSVRPTRMHKKPTTKHRKVLWRVRS